MYITIILLKNTSSSWQDEGALGLDYRIIIFLDQN